MTDPWKHRASGMKCQTCMWFAPKLSTPHTENGALGRCRRHAPTMSGFPAVFEADWCGDHKLDENRLANKAEQQKFAFGVAGSAIGGATLGGKIDNSGSPFASNAAGRAQSSDFYSPNQGTDQ